MAWYSPSPRLLLRFCGRNDQCYVTLDMTQTINDALLKIIFVGPRKKILLNAGLILQSGRTAPESSGKAPHAQDATAVCSGQVTGTTATFSKQPAYGGSLVGSASEAAVASAAVTPGGLLPAAGAQGPAGVARRGDSLPINTNLQQSNVLMGATWPGALAAKTTGRASTRSAVSCVRIPE